MAGTGVSSPFIKEEPEDFFSSNQGFMNNNQQGYNMSHQQFNNFGGHGGGINPSDLTMGGIRGNVSNNTYGASFQDNFNAQASNSLPRYQRGIATFDDDELLDSLVTGNDTNKTASPMQNNGHDFGLDFDLSRNMYPGQSGVNPVSIDSHHINGYSNTPEGDPIQSPFVHNFNQAQFRQIQQHHAFNNALHSPAAYAGSPLQGSDLLSGSATRPRLSQVMQGRKCSHTRSPLTPKTPVISSLHIGSAEGSSYSSQPIRTTPSHRHQQTLSGQWDQTPSSLTSFPGSEFNSPVHGVHPNPQISDILKGASMPTKLNGQPNGGAPALQQQNQEMKRRRRRESHNLVERRRRDNINERIQELSHLVPLHRLENEKVRKAIANDSPLSPTLAGLSAPLGTSPPAATSSLAAPGSRRATAGNITTGIPLDEKDKGPNKGDILNGAVSWTRDLMWMLHLKLQQQEDLANIITELGGTFPFEQTDDEKRMHSELMDAMHKNQGEDFQYSRGAGSGLRVPKHTDFNGEPVGMSGDGSPDLENNGSGEAAQTGLGVSTQYWNGHNSGDSGAGSISFKEEDEYGAMNLDD